MSNLFTVSPSPHIHSGDSARKIMYRVVFAMMPAALWSVFVFGIGALYVTCLLYTSKGRYCTINRLVEGGGN